MSVSPSTSTSPRAASASASTSAVAGLGLREFVRNPQLVGATLGQGILFLLVFRYVFGGAIQTPESHYVNYLTPGIVTAGILFAATTAATGAAQDRASGLTEHLATLPASRLGLALGRVLADTVSIGSAVGAMLVVAVLVGFRPGAPLGQLLAGGGLLLLYAVAFASLFGALGAAAPTPQTAQGLGFLAIPLTFISSAYVPPDVMPKGLAWVAANQPVTTMIEALRHLTDEGSASWAILIRAMLYSVLMVVCSVAAIARASDQGK